MLRFSQTAAYAVPLIFEDTLTTHGSIPPTGTVTLQDGTASIGTYPVYVWENGHVIGLIFTPLKWQGPSTGPRPLGREPLGTQQSKAKRGFNFDRMPIKSPGEDDVLCHRLRKQSDNYLTSKKIWLIVGSIRPIKKQLRVTEKNPDRPRIQHYWRCGECYESVRFCF